MMQALAQVKNELGTDALVVSARQIPGGSPWQVWRKPMVEVVAVRLEPGEEPSLVGKKETNAIAAPSDKRSSIKDLTRKDTVIPKQGNLSGSNKKQSNQQQMPAQEMPEAASPNKKSPDELLDDPISNTQPVDVVELQGKRVGKQIANNPKLDLIQQLGREEVTEDLNILQVSDWNQTRSSPTSTAQPALEPTAGTVQETCMEHGRCWRNCICNYCIRVLIPDWFNEFARSVQIRLVMKLQWMKPGLWIIFAVSWKPM